MIFVRWAAASRTIGSAEVDTELALLRDEVLLFAFATDRLEVGEHTGQLSVKLVTRGCERYRLDRRSIWLRPGQVLVLNAGQLYSSSVEQPGTQSISCFLPAAVAAAAFVSFAGGASTILDATGEQEPPRELLQVPFRPGRELQRAIARLAAAVMVSDRRAGDRLEEQVLCAAGLALREAGALPPVTVLAGARRATREELVARVLRARDLVHDRGGRVALAAMAEAACLSKFHFLRVFREVFGVTPAAYGRAIRLQRGAQRLRAGSATAAARAAGFSSASTLLRALRRRAARRR